MATKKPVPQDILTALDEKFCREYLIDLNGTRAYLRCKPDVTPGSAEVLANRMLGKVKIKQRLGELVKEQEDRVSLTADEALKDTFRMLRADPRELISYEVTCCRHCYGTDYRYQRTQLEMERDRANHEKKQEEEGEKNNDHLYEPFDEQGGGSFDGKKPPNPDCEVCWGRGVGTPILRDLTKLSPEAMALYAGVKVTKEGLEVKMHNVDAARERLFKHFGLYEKDNSQKAPVIFNFDLGGT